MDAVWRYFDDGRAHYGRAWPVHYRTSARPSGWTRCDALGVRAFPALVYPHKPGMAESLSEWAMEFAARGAGVRAERDVLRRAERGELRAARRWKPGPGCSRCTCRSAGYDPRDPLLREVWGLLAEAGVPVVVHCGSGPMPGAHTGPGRSARCSRPIRR